MTNNCLTSQNYILDTMKSNTKPYRSLGNIVANDDYTRYVGYQQDTGTNEDCGVNYYFSREVIDLISRKVTELTKGIDPQNRNIIVPDDRIASVMSDIYTSYRPQTGDIYSRYNIPLNDPRNNIQEMIDQTIEVITSDIKNNLEMEEYNRTLTVWTTLYGDFNKHGLRQFPPIKVLKRRADRCQFQMNY
jgi:hypothetical protein